MVSFFRKIRQKLLQQNRVTRYLVYALGEILLVTIGILIALQINTWNSERQENQEEIKTLKALKVDFLQSKENVERTIFNQSRVVNLNSKLLKALIEEDISLNPDTLGMYIYRGALSYWKVELTNGTYDALISSGKTSLLKNAQLNRHMAEYAAQLKFGFEDDDESIDLTSILVEKGAVYSPILGIEMLKEFQFINTQKSYTPTELDRAKSQLMEDKSFIGVLAKKAILEINRLDYHQRILAKLNVLLELIDQELDLKDKP
ncbi:hypothetical protein DFQ04_1662 [Algoriphagus boseongensis]|uniref:Uncharacterized protein n=1 Tax=Algoriphagus boseongensis TaxID=1442587 RepID=A0A4R6T4Y2_9BACT|nr:DUF6090 family protein [Algoriphagus boseongensis]TDQ17014.1 hypothetical protein DFQ04_1662 [Algoriphagus boseongensis]